MGGIPIPSGPVLVGESPTGTQSDGVSSSRHVFARGRIPASAGPVARRHGRVARSTQEIEAPKKVEKQKDFSGHGLGTMPSSSRRSIPRPSRRNAGKQEHRKKEIKLVARIGRIGRLPKAVRARLNTRLQDGHEGKQIVHWLNSNDKVHPAPASAAQSDPAPLAPDSGLSATPPNPHIS